jgi:hypothetical protein
MSDSKYNGWTNYETWNAALWIDNDWRMSERLHLQAGDFLSSYEQDDSIEKLAGIIRELFYDMMPELEAGFFSDVMSASLLVVNFREIASHYIDEMVEINE